MPSPDKMHDSASPGPCSAPQAEAAACPISRISARHVLSLFRISTYILVIFITRRRPLISPPKLASNRMPFHRFRPHNYPRRRYRASPLVKGDAQGRRNAIKLGTRADAVASILEKAPLPCLFDAPPRHHRDCQAEDGSSVPTSCRADAALTPRRYALCRRHIADAAGYFCPCHTVLLSLAMLREPFLDFEHGILCSIARRPRREIEEFY